MAFEQFADKINARIQHMCAKSAKLYRVSLDANELWELYLDSFAPEDNKVYRERREHDCSSCRSFVKSFGNVVAIIDGKIETIWKVEVDSKYQRVADALDKFVSQKPIENVLVTKLARFGTESNLDLNPQSTVMKWHHLYTVLPANKVTRSSESEASIMGDLRATRNVFKRSLDEITLEAVDTLLELIAQNSLYKGEEWQPALSTFRFLQKEYAQLGDTEKDLYTWIKSSEVGVSVARIRNHSIGTLLQDISADEDLDEAVRKYEAMVAPTNYKRPKAIFSKRMLEDAQKTLEELGLMDSLPRRHAKLDDITVNNILFANKDASKRIGGSVFEEMAGNIGVNPKTFSKVEEVPIQKFVTDILPTTKNISMLVENRHASNLMSVLAPVNTTAPTLFKWNNGFSWAYSGNIADSMKQNVKKAGGNVEGVLRFSIQWNDNDDNLDDLDAHCLQPNKTLIFFGSKRDGSTTGVLDVDIIHPDGVAVENITWSSISRMPEGTYQFKVHCYNSRGAKSGFSAEIEFDGQIHSFSHAAPLRGGQKVDVADVTYSRVDGFKLIEKLPSSASQRTIWGINTNQFCPVSVCMYSPNYWDEQDGIGNRHYLFILKDCINPENPNGFFNEYLKEDFMKHKRVFEALGNKMRVEDSNEQLSGIGFSSTQKNSVILKVEGQTTRTIKVVF